MSKTQIAAQVTKSDGCWIAGVVFIEAGEADIRLESASDERAAKAWVESQVVARGLGDTQIVYIAKPDA